MIYCPRGNTEKERECRFGFCFPFGRFVAENQTNFRLVDLFFSRWCVVQLPHEFGARWDTYANALRPDHRFFAGSRADNGWQRPFLSQSQVYGRKR